MLRIKKGDVEEFRNFGMTFIDVGPGGAADGAAAPTSILTANVLRRCCAIRPGISFGKDEIPNIEWLHRRTAAWGAAFELDYYFVCLESRCSA